jgi:hypothetical protein
MRTVVPLAVLLLASTVVAQAPDRPSTLASVPPLATLVYQSGSELTFVVERFSLDSSALGRRYDAVQSPAQRQRMRDFFEAWRTRLREIDFDKLGQEGRIDYVLLDNHLQYQLTLLDRRSKQRTETMALLPFADRLLALQDARRNLETVNHPMLARTIADVAKHVDSLRAQFDPGASRAVPAAPTDTIAPIRPRFTTPRVSRTVANRAAERIDQIRQSMTGWYRFYDGYDPRC